MKRFLWHKLANREEETQRHLETIEFGRVPGFPSLEELEVQMSWRLCSKPKGSFRRWLCLVLNPGWGAS